MKKGEDASVHQKVAGSGLDAARAKHGPKSATRKPLTANAVPHSSENVMGTTGESNLEVSNSKVTQYELEGLEFQLGVPDTYNPESELGTTAVEASRASIPNPESDGVVRDRRATIPTIPDDP